MEIRKRNGESVPFQQEKIFNAMKKAFDGQGKEIGSREMDEIIDIANSKCARQTHE